MSTICAIATAQGGAIGIIRVSGEDAIKYTDSIFESAHGHKLTDVIQGPPLLHWRRWYRNYVPRLELHSAAGYGTTDNAGVQRSKTRRIYAEGIPQR